MASGRQAVADPSAVAVIRAGQVIQDGSRFEV